MDKFVFDKSKTAYFKGITIPFEDLNNGISFAIENKVKNVFLKNGESDERRTFDFSILKDLNFVEVFHFTILLTKRTDISPIYDFKNLSDLRWVVDNEFELKLSRFNNLKTLNIKYSDKAYDWDNLKSIEKLQIANVNSIDLTFLSKIKTLKYLRLIGGKFESLNGIQNIESLEYLICQKCSKLKDVQSILNTLKKLDGISFESCKKIDLDEDFISKWGEKLFIM